MSISARRKSVFESRPTGSKIRQTQRRPVKAAILRVHPFGVNAAELARRKFLHLAAGAATLPAMSRSAEAQTYPTRPLTMIVPFPAGGAVDVIARIMAERMQGSLRQPIIIENIGGADGGIGVGRAARARPDGYTICLGPDSTFVLNGAFYSLPYDVLNDFVPISPLATGPIVLVARKTMPAEDLSELIAWLKAHPNQASAGMNVLSFRLLAMHFQKQTGTQFTIVPYRATGSLVGDLIAGQIDLAFGTLTSHLPLLRAGSEKAYVVAGETRSALAPDIPTFAEMGLPALSYTTWYGLFAPRGTPKDIVVKLSAAAVEALADPAARSRLAELGYEAFPHERQTPEALDTLQKADAAKWWPLIKEFGIKAE
jgi:tripartite-type tricarboxylate transporter receptor subunit TctC